MVTMIRLIKNSFSATLYAVRTHKKLFILLIFFQILVLVFLFTHAFQAQLAIGKDLQQLGLQIQQANYNPEELKAGKAFVQDPLQVFQLYRSLKKNLLLFAVQFGGIFLLGQGILWLGTHFLFRKNNELRKWNEFRQQIFKYLATVFSFYGLFFLVFYLVIKSQLSAMDAQILGTTLRYFGYAFLMMYYFLTMALAFLYIPEWKVFFNCWFQFAVKRYYFSLPIFIISLLPAAAGFYGIFYAVQIQSSFPLMLLFTLVFILFLVLGRIFFIASLRELASKEKIENMG
ncbi:hypothetical protein HYX13_04320 [Candidatus Woesearchaeota archaeon]|nr:hypothetical protein [Candidatus Woesearchaeota archaeon]